MNDFQDTIDGLFQEIEIRLSAKLLTVGLRIHSQVFTGKDFGSRYTEWRHEVDKYALRLIWDGKEGWFLVEESAIMGTKDPLSWADIVFVPVDKTQLKNVSYKSWLVEDIIKEVK